jgi:hypothetical protein
MLIARTIAQVQIGGDGSDNPVPFGDANFDFDQTQLQFSYADLNVIVYHNNLHTSLEVTGKVKLDSRGNPMIGPLDLVYCPCPPFCDPDH